MRRHYITTYANCMPIEIETPIYLDFPQEREIIPVLLDGHPSHLVKLRSELAPWLIDQYP
jgi:hypothetical protein